MDAPVAAPARITPDSIESGEVEILAKYTAPSWRGFYFVRTSDGRGALINARVDGMGHVTKITGCLAFPIERLGEVTQVINAAYRNVAEAAP